MHVEANITQVPYRHLYEESSTSTISLAGYDCQTDLWKTCLFTKANKDSTDMAHNGAGYDNKFILKLCIDHGLNPAKLISKVLELHTCILTKWI
jgi:hypothetical protein